MRSSTGLYVSRLDHVRAAAAFLVYCWHFVHANVPYGAVPDVYLLSLLEEGHAGVALFMTLSGYLFAKIMDGRPIDLGRFYRNRFLRLAPLLVVVLVYWAMRGRFDLANFIRGFVLPTWTGGTWSIVVELHFYAIFPLILLLQGRHRILPLGGLLVASTSIRCAVWALGGEVQSFSYWTIGGCIDLFVLGMLWHELAATRFVRRHPVALFSLAFVALAVGWHIFNLQGGFYELGGYPSPAPVWIVLPTLQGLAFGAMIVGYERMAFAMPGLLDRALARVGEVSYSIYLMHFILYPTLAKQCGRLGWDMSDLGVSLLFAAATFPVIVAVSLVTFELIEKPFLRLRSSYRATPAPRPAPPQGLPPFLPAGAR